MDYAYFTSTTNPRIGISMSTILDKLNNPFIVNLATLPDTQELTFTLPTAMSTQSSTITDGISQNMMSLIAKWETGKNFGYTMLQKDLAGYNLGDAKGHKTFGYGLLYHPVTGKFMDQVKSNWSLKELEDLYKTSINKIATKVKAWATTNGANLNLNQLDAIVSACYNFGTGFLNKNIAKKILKNPNDTSIKYDWEHLSDVQGKKYPGLIKRRKIEADWYFK